MKTQKVCLLSLFFLLGLVSCNNNESNYLEFPDNGNISENVIVEKSKELKELETKIIERNLDKGLAQQKILLDFLELRDREYFFKLDINSAKRIGISEEMYNSALVDFNKINKLIRENKDVYLSDPQKINFDEVLSLKMKVKDYAPGGWMESENSFGGCTHITMSVKHRFVHFLCVAYDDPRTPSWVLPTYSFTCSVSNGSGPVSSRSAIGFLGSASIEVPYSVMQDNTLIQVCAQSSAPYGGYVMVVALENSRPTY